MDDRTGVMDVWTRWWTVVFVALVIIHCICLLTPSVKATNTYPRERANAHGRAVTIAWYEVCSWSFALIQAIWSDMQSSEPMEAEEEI